jgi:hypothetical protein
MSGEDEAGVAVPAPMEDIGITAVVDLSALGGAGVGAAAEPCESGADPGAGARLSAATCVGTAWRESE